MNSRDVIAMLQRDGWLQVVQKGSHVQLNHPVQTGRVTAPHPGKDLPRGTLRSIEKRSGLKLR